MVSTAIAAELTGVLRDLGTGVELQRRALGSSMRHLVHSAGGTEASRARLAREVQIPPAHLLGWIAGALDLATSRLTSELTAPVRGSQEDAGYAIVDRSLTRC